jgi:hypothetical protein
MLIEPPQFDQIQTLALSSTMPTNPQPAQPTMMLAGIPLYAVEGMKGFAIVSPPAPVVTFPASA